MSDNRSLIKEQVEFVERYKWHSWDSCISLRHSFFWTFKRIKDYNVKLSKYKYQLMLAWVEEDKNNAS